MYTIIGKNEIVDMQGAIFMLLTDKEIRKLCDVNEKDAEKKSLIYPFSEKYLQSEGYDLAIGEEYAVANKNVGVIDLEDENLVKNSYVPKVLTKDGYIISPKEYVLVALQERINLPENLNAHIRPRTKFTRLGLILSAQNCNSTYSGVLRLGLFNATNFSIKITPGLRIGQVFFEELKDIPSKEKLYKNLPNSSYQNETEFRGPRFSNEVKEEARKLLDSILGKE